MTTMTSLPAALRAMVDGYATDSGVDFAAADAVRSECETHSRLLAAWIDAQPPVIEWVTIDGEEIDLEIHRRTWTCRRWEGSVPAALEGDALAIGHVVCRVEWDGETYEIDMTAAQFAVLGWTGPRARTV